MRLAALALLVCLTAGCGEPYRRPELPATYTVKAGDTVYNIAWRHGLDHRDLARWNNLPKDYRIQPGQRLLLHSPSGARPLPPPPPATAGRPTQKKPATVNPGPPIAPPAVPPGEGVAAWVWPTLGPAQKVRHAATGSAGLLISGSIGQDVKAAAAGKVVYRGSGLRGFGELTIIKHSNVFLSAYGHNRSLLVKEGDAVAAGQKIGEMGLGPKQQPVLYFEIRFNGQPIDPMFYLPKR